MRALAISLALAGCVDTGLLEDVSYDPRFGSATTMDIHVPAGSSAARPAVMLIHGGAWRYGDKDNYTDAAERLASAGYVAATINYRLYPTATYPASVQDCVCALSFLRANAATYGIDPDRIAVSGYSAGGHLSALVGVASDLHQPDCEWGPTAPPAAVIPGDSRYNFTDDNASGWFEDWMGGSLADMPEQYKAASPALQVHPGAPPFLVVHGHDDVVDVNLAYELRDALHAQDVPTRMLDIGGAGHVTSAVTATEGVYLQPSSDTPEAWAVTLDFLDHTLGAP